MVAYWGQNGVYAIHKERERWEKELDYFCKSHSYDVVVLAFNHIFFDRRNKGKFKGSKARIMRWKSKFERCSAKRCGAKR